jgi:hypothetical protein
MDIDDLGEYFCLHAALSPARTYPRIELTLLAVDNTYELGGEDDAREREQNAVLIEQLERKKKLRTMAVPTDDKKVRERLRAYGEPITLFGEGVSWSILCQWDELMV